MTIALTACAPRLAQMGMEMRDPAIAGPPGAEMFVTRDGLRLGLRHWDAGTPRAVIVALHGMNDYSRAFAIPAPRWAELGITTYAYDQRGFGRSPNTGLWPGAEVMRRDLADFVGAVRARHPASPVFVLGESMGGAVTMSALASEMPPEADGYILVSPAVWGWRALPFSYRAALWLTAHIAPWWTFTGSGLEITPSDNIEMLRENARDPLFLKDTRTDTIYGLVGLMDDAYRVAAELDGAPLLLVYGGRDEVIPNMTTEEIAAGFGGDATVKFYPGGYHMILRDLEAAPRWDDIVAWVDAQTQRAAAVPETAPEDAGGS